MKILILFILLNLAFADQNCDKSEFKISETVQTSNNLGYYFKKRFLKVDRKIALGSNQLCELSDIYARRKKLKCKPQQFGMIKKDGEYCVCSKIEILDTLGAVGFILPSCLSIDDIHAD
jgi:hypothetical protein